MKETLKLVIVGSVDHGKSTLIGRLLFDSDSLPREKIEEIEKTCKMLGRNLEFAYLIDHLQEEREKEMTIDTSQTFFKSVARNYVIIDAPGHKEFIQNMMTGASQAQAAILIIDGSEGVVEQTKRHAYILKLLDFKNIIVAVNKIDKLNYDQQKFEVIKKQIFEFFKELGLCEGKIIPISAKAGDNVVKKSIHTKWFLGKTILEELDQIEIKKDVKSDILRLPIQDVYEIEGQKIFAGKIEQGGLKNGSKVLIMPEKKEAKISNILNFDGRKINYREKAEIGFNTGVIIKGNSSAISRGEVICDTDKTLPKVNKKISANIFWLDQNNMCKLYDSLMLKCATQEISGKIKEIEKRIDSSSLKLLQKNAKELKHTEVGEVVIDLEKPLVYEDFDKTPELGRFVLMQNENVVAGGIIKS